MKYIDEGNNKFTFGGTCTFWVDNSKYVVVDGETYRNGGYVDEVRDISTKEEQDKLMYFDYDFNHIGYKIEIKDTTSYNYSYSKEIIRYSENTNVNRLLGLYNSGLLNSDIKDITTDKGGNVYYPLTHPEDWNGIVNGNDIYFTLFGYGFNNFVIYSVNIGTLLSMDVNKIPENVIELFNYGGINLKEKSVMKKALKFYDAKIRNKNSKTLGYWKFLRY